MTKFTRLQGVGRLGIRLHHRFITELSTAEMKQSAVIFAPHPDDETLACGGTILKKVREGAAVHVVFMTDGSRSHSAWMSKDRLKALRKKEALAAAEVLGLVRENVVFMNCENGHLRQRSQEMLQDVKDLLQRLKPEQVYIPCGLEGVADHVAANKLVVSALGDLVSKPMVFEYPVWFWLHWPWVTLPFRRPKQMLELMRPTVTGLFGMKLMSTFRSGVYIRDVLDYKRRCLALYRTQMVRMIPGVKWPILSDVARGEFLQCFFQDYEIFYRYRMKPLEQEVSWPVTTCAVGEKHFS